MKNEKAAIIKRLAIYVVLAFAPLLIAVPILNSALDGKLFTGELAGSPVTALVSSLAMLLPAIASILTRLITKEGFRETYLRLNFKGNAKYYLAALLLPIVYGLIGALLARSEYGAAETGLSSFDSVTLIISQTGTALMMAFYGLGEELGWRGYMMPKLEKLIGTPASVLVGGIIWGLWHAPLTCSGHNFGTGYSGFPYVGIGLMCLFCTLIGCLLTYLTKRTKSVFPAAILHIVNNNTMPVFFSLLVTANLSSTVKPFLFNLIPVGIISVISFVLLTKKRIRQHQSDGYIKAYKDL